MIMVISEVIHSHVEHIGHTWYNEGATSGKLMVRENIATVQK